MFLYFEDSLEYNKLLDQLYLDKLEDLQDLENLRDHQNLDAALDVLMDEESALLCESALLVKGKSFVTLYTDFSFKELKENALVKDFLYSSKKNALENKDLKNFSLAATAFFFNCLKEKSVYKVTKYFPLDQLQSHNSVNLTSPFGATS